MQDFSKCAETKGILEASSRSTFAYHFPLHPGTKGRIESMSSILKEVPMP